MNRILRISAIFLVYLLACSTADAFDSIKTAKSTIVGRITSISPEKVTIEPTGGGATKEISVNEIQIIYFDEDPIELKTAKNHILGGRYAEALAALDRLKENPSRREIQQDVEFYRALCASKLALVGNGTIQDAGRMMKSFVDNNPRSYHYFEASETVGDLLVAIKLYVQAAEYYGRIEKAPWPDYKMRAGVAAGRALLAQGKIPEAQSTFEKVIANDAPGDLAQSQRIMAKLGKATCLSMLKRYDDAIKLAEDVLKNADPEDIQLMARAYAVLGNAHRQAGHTKEAILAFLHVDLLYPCLPDVHAEALANLVELWEEVHKPERANQTRKILEEDYKDSDWAKKVLEKNAAQ